MAIGFRFREQLRDKIIHRQTDEEKEPENEKRVGEIFERRDAGGRKRIKSSSLLLLA